MRTPAGLFKRSSGRVHGHNLPARFTLHARAPSRLLHMDHVERRSHDAAHRPPPAKHLRGAGPAPLKVYCVEPRDFRELVQRLTGAGSAAQAPEPAMGAAPQNHGRVEEATGQFDYSPWYAAPMFSPAYAPGGFSGHQ
jgi:hypothetical protein